MQAQKNKDTRLKIAGIKGHVNKQRSYIGINKSSTTECTWKSERLVVMKTGTLDNT